MAFAYSARQSDGEHRALSHHGAQSDPIVQKLCQSLHDGEPETEALATVPLWIVELVELMKDLVVAVCRNAFPGVPDLDPHFVAFTPTSEHDTARVGVANGVGKQAPDQAHEQRRIALYE